MPHFNRANLPEGMPDEMVKQYERAHMMNEDIANEIVDFIRNLKPDQLMTFSKVLSNCGHPETGLMATAAYQGWTDAAITFLHNRCFICGRDHDAEMLEPHGKPAVQGPPIEESATDPFDLPMPGQMWDNDTTATDVNRDHSYPDGIEPFLTVVETNQMHEYHLDDAWSELEDGSLKFAGFACTGISGTPCGAIYPSIADRMLRNPDSCPQCFQKAKFG